MENGLKPIWIFDGKPLIGKYRFNEKIQAKKQIEINSDHEKRKYECLSILKLFGVPTIKSKNDSEAQCAYFCKEFNNIIKYAISEDLDCLA